MSDWTVMAAPFHVRQSAAGALRPDRRGEGAGGRFPLEGRLLFSNIGKFTKGMPKYVMMLDGIEVEFPHVDHGLKGSASLEPIGRGLGPSWWRS